MLSIYLKSAGAYPADEHACPVQMKTTVLDQFSLCAPTQRLARIGPAAKAGEAIAVGSSWPQHMLGQPYGPGGVADGVFSSWVDLHNGFFGQEHLSAFLHLTGRKTHIDQAPCGDCGCHCVTFRTCGCLLFRHVSMRT